MVMMQKRTLMQKVGKLQKNNLSTGDSSDAVKMKKTTIKEGI